MTVSTLCHGLVEWLINWLCLKSTKTCWPGPHTNNAIWNSQTKCLRKQRHEHISGAYYPHRNRLKTRI